MAELLRIWNKLEGVPIPKKKIDLNSVSLEELKALVAQKEALAPLEKRRAEILKELVNVDRELKRLTGVDVPAGPGERADALRKLVIDTGITLVHKGAPTVSAHAGGRIDVNVHGHPGLATAGSGDVLTGAIAGMLASGAAPDEAARLGVYIHSRAAEIAAELTGEHGMIAGDCSDSLPMAVRELEELTP